MVNSKTWDYADSIFALGTLEFGDFSFAPGCAHTTPQAQSYSWSMLSAGHLTVLWV
jgi:hypothetical protein